MAKHAKKSAAAAAPADDSVSIYTTEADGTVRPATAEEVDAYLHARRHGSPF